MLSDRRQQLVEQRIAAVNRLHDLLQDLLPGGASKRLTAAKAHEILAGLKLSDPVGQARKQLAVEHAGDGPALARRSRDRPIGTKVS